MRNIRLDRSLVIVRVLIIVLLIHFPASLAMTAPTVASQDDNAAVSNETLLKRINDSYKYSAFNNLHQLVISLLEEYNSCDTALPGNEALCWQAITKSLCHSTSTKCLKVADATLAFFIGKQKFLSKSTSEEILKRSFYDGALIIAESLIPYVNQIVMGYHATFPRCKGSSKPCKKTNYCKSLRDYNNVPYPMCLAAISLANNN